MDLFARQAVDEAVLYPYEKPVLMGFRGGLAWSQRERLPVARHHRQGQPVCQPEQDDRPVGRLRGSFIFGGPMLLHFGHFASESIHRLLHARQAEPGCPILFCGRRQHGAGQASGMPGFATEMLGLLGIGPEAVTVVSRPTRVDRLLIHPQGSDLGAGPTEAYLDLLGSNIGARLAGPSDRPARVYVSRSTIPEGMILGEGFLEGKLAAAGFHVVHPERLPILEQMQLYAGADLVLMGEGSACHGAELLGRNLKSIGIYNRRNPVIMSRFKNLLAPRAQQFHLFDGNIYLGSITRDDGKAHDNHGVSLLNWAGMVDFMQSMDVNAVAYSDFDDYVASARLDLVRHLDHTRSITKDPAIQRLQLKQIEKLEDTLNDAIAMAKAQVKRRMIRR